MCHSFHVNGKKCVLVSIQKRVRELTLLHMANVRQHCVHDKVYETTQFIQRHSFLFDINSDREQVDYRLYQASTSNMEIPSDI